MTVRGLMLLAGTATLAVALSQGPAFAQTHHHYYHYHHHHHHHYWGGPRVVRSNPVPDTPRNRERFGGPRSQGGRQTAPVGN
jgi:hypothetical protein